jgi:hypothetical protein
MNVNIQMQVLFHICKITMILNQMFLFFSYMKIIHHQVRNQEAYKEIDQNDVSNKVE